MVVSKKRFMGFNPFQNCTNIYLLKNISFLRTLFLVEKNRLIYYYLNNAIAGKRCATIFYNVYFRHANKKDSDKLLLIFFFTEKGLLLWSLQKRGALNLFWLLIGTLGGWFLISNFCLFFFTLLFKLMSLSYQVF